MSFDSMLNQSDTLQVNWRPWKHVRAIDILKHKGSEMYLSVFCVHRAWTNLSDISLDKVGGSKMVCMKTTLCQPSCLQRRETNRSDHAFRLSLKIGSLTWKHSSIMYLQQTWNSLDRWHSLLSCLSFDGSSRSTLCQNRLQVSDACAVYSLCQSFIFSSHFPPGLSQYFYFFSQANVNALHVMALDLITPNESALLLTNSYHSTALSHSCSN